MLLLGQNVYLPVQDLRGLPGPASSIMAACYEMEVLSHRLEATALRVTQSRSRLRRKLLLCHIDEVCYPAQPSLS